jgi:predicted O-methyltransferase YrrM
VAESSDQLVGQPETKAAIDRMAWHEGGVTLDGTRFQLGVVGDAEHAVLRLESEAIAPDELMLQKPRWELERYVELVKTLRPRRIVELGIWLGGSVAFLALLANPDKHVAIDIRPDAGKKFATWLESHNDVVRPYFGVDQGDATRLRTIIADEFADDPLDLVIDDASHLLGPTRTSFNALFPLLRRGGVYVIEDWVGVHEFERAAAKDPAVEERVRHRAAELAERWEQMTLTRLVFEIVLASACTDLVDDISIRRHSVTVTKGSEQPNPEVFDIARCQLGLGRRVLGDAWESNA